MSKVDLGNGRSIDRTEAETLIADIRASIGEEASRQGLDLTADEIKRLISDTLRDARPSHADIVNAERAIQSEAQAAEAVEIAGLSDQDFAKLQRANGVRPYGDSAPGGPRVVDATIHRPKGAE